jgi:lysyl-tRNA synthetase class 2
MLSDWLVEDSNVDADNDILLDYIFSEIIEPTIGIEVPCFIYNFPKSQASLAKISILDERVAERFECYYRGVELVNGFHELTDENTQVKRFQKDNEKRICKGLVEKTIDERFIASLIHGLPQCSGVALGIDRLVMLALNMEHIDQVVTFPIDRA